MWKNDTRVSKGLSQGVYKFANGNVYSGKWRDDKRDGKVS